ncbi:MAG: DUF4347 domain-containing protein [Comamonadaceae bacterium]|nr:DUF4347 domain-containing protein [Comamonadaceae bacterium]
MDRANVDVCGPAIVHLFKRAYNTYGDKRYERLANPGTLHLGNMVLSSANLDAYRVQLRALGNGLTENGDILLYGCHVAQGVAL